ncbi:inovirus-type Gp2 protein [Thiomicrospira microaerophila]|uniref:YagK/YfjJ domain-containing protein n=1 Tax=Thiomicrospira microaerophila TaxID=406020 RepID=UPI00200BE6CD|nr:inovirus-type Gp2 protein [Thiomicrospira microaerophila]UQB42891.1 inovirus-type Gp2 protein [Thiomicrospira microaerophila]
MTITPFAQCSAFVNACLLYEAQDDYWIKQTRLYLQRQFNIIQDPKPSGFSSAVLSNSITLEPSPGLVEEPFESGRLARIFLLSKEMPDPANNEMNTKQFAGAKTQKRPPAKRSKSGINRKHISHQNTIEINGQHYPVNSKPTGIYTAMLKPAIAQYFICREKWRRVLAIRVDLHIHVYFDNNARMSHLMKILIRKLKGVYNLKEVGYYWAREVEKSKKQHYHIMLFLDGNKVKHSFNVIRIAKALWVENWAG